jgi:deoxyribodipyrimidine photo-lyase
MSVRSYQEILDLIDAVDVVAYATTRNHLGGAVSKLSPYISRGVVTLSQIRERILTRYSKSQAQKFLQELAWREYFQRVWWNKGDAIFSDLRFPRDDWRHSEVVSAIADATTGIETIDDTIRILYDTGYMHNHARMWTASIACNIAGAHWYNMGRWLYAHLYDGDLASNFLSWQWVVGTSMSKRYTVNQSLINACSTHQQPYSWLNLDREATLTMSIPEPLVPSESFTLITNYPETVVPSVSGEEVCLYTPWTLNPEWRREQRSRRILIIDPTWFDRFPVSDAVLDFIIRQGQTVIPELEVFVGTYAQLPGVDGAAEIFFTLHPTNTNWQGNPDEPAWLFPQVRGYFPSFMAYWKKVERFQ